MGSFKPISREDFEAIEDINTKLNILYGYTIDLGKKLDAVTSQSKWYKTISFVAGIIGGFVAGLTRYLGIR